MSKLRIALALNRNVQFHCDMAVGMGRFLELHPEWELVNFKHQIFPTPGEVLKMSLDGVLLGFLGPEDELALRQKKGLITILTSNRKPDPGLPSVRADDYEVGRMAARHFLDLGLKRMVFIGLADSISFSRQREVGFTEVVEQHGAEWRRHIWGDHPNLGDDQIFDQLVERLRIELEPPFGLFCVNDLFAKVISDACRRKKLMVPAEVAILGVDNSSLLCSLNRPSLSSVALDGERMGFEAGRMMDRLYRGEAGPVQVLVPPKEVVQRRSTEILNIADRVIARALGRMREAEGKNLKVDDLAREMGVSRRLFEMRFRAATGRSPHEEMIACRMAFAVKLLRQTDWAVQRIAEKCGYRDIRGFHHAFRKCYGKTPSALRKAGWGE